MTARRACACFKRCELHGLLPPERYCRQHELRCPACDAALLPQTDDKLIRAVFIDGVLWLADEYVCPVCQDRHIVVPGNPLGQHFRIEDVAE